MEAKIDSTLVRGKSVRVRAYCGTSFAQAAARRPSGRLRLPLLAEIHDSQHRAIVGVELDLSLACHPNGPHTGESELPTDVVAGEGQEGFADWPPD